MRVGEWENVHKNCPVTPQEQLEYLLSFSCNTLGKVYDKDYNQLEKPFKIKVSRDSHDFVHIVVHFQDREMAFDLSLQAADEVLMDPGKFLEFAIREAADAKAPEEKQCPIE